MTPLLMRRLWYVVALPILQCRAIVYDSQREATGRPSGHRPLFRREGVALVDVADRQLVESPEFTNSGFDGPPGSAVDVPCNLSTCGTENAWTIGGNESAVLKVKSGNFWGPASATSGSYFLAMTEQGSWVEQVIQPAANINYVVSFDVAKQADAHEACVKIFVNDVKQDAFCVQPDRYQWVRRTVPFKSSQTGRSSKVRFENGGAEVLFLDTVRVEEASVKTWEDGIFVWSTSPSNSTLTWLKTKLRTGSNFSSDGLLTFSNVGSSLPEMPWYHADPATREGVKIETLSVLVNSSTRVFMATKPGYGASYLDRSSNIDFNATSLNWTLNDGTKLSVYTTDIECGPEAKTLTMRLDVNQLFLGGVALWPIL